MPGKLQHSRKKRSPQGKKKKGRQSPSAVVVQQQSVVQIDKPVDSPEVVTPVVSALTPLRYPYALTELRRIGILGGIILVILVVLLLVLA